MYHWRGYAGSSAVHGPGSIARDAADCHALLDALGIGRAHTVGVSYSAAVALQLAADAPHVVHTLALLEPPPVHTQRAAQFYAAIDRLMSTRRRHGPPAALDEFLSMPNGPDWRDITEHHLPGSAAQMAQDAATFFDTDLPALLDWQLGPTDAARITCPVLHIGGTNSGPWFAQAGDQLLAWLPSANDVAIEDADHALALTHHDEIADAVAAFLRNHPLDREAT